MSWRIAASSSANSWIRGRTGILSSSVCWAGSIAGRLCGGQLTAPGEVLLGEVDSPFGTNIIWLTLHQIEARTQAFSVGHLNCQARSRVELQQHRALIAVEGDIHPQVAQTSHLVAVDSQKQQIAPAVDAQAGELLTRVGMIVAGAIELYAANGGAAGDVEAHPNGPLVKVGLAVGSCRGKAHHRHHRITAKHDHPDVWYALVGIGCKAFVKADQRLNQRHVGRAAEGIEA